MTARKRKPASNGAAPERVTWLTPFWDDWKHRFDGDPPGAILAKTLKPLVAKHGEEPVRVAWRRFLLAQNAAYVSIPKFGQTYGAWAGKKPAELGRAEKTLNQLDEWAKGE